MCWFIFCAKKRHKMYSLLSDKFSSCSIELFYNNIQKSSANCHPGEALYKNTEKNGKKHMIFFLLLILKNT